METERQPDCDRATILIVEDELLIRWAIADHLQECGFKTLAASSADEAIEALQRYESPIEIVFSDVRLPGSLDGFGLATWLKQHRPEIAVILTSGHARAADVAQDLCAHVGEIIRKPYDFDAVRARIERILSMRTG